MKPYLATLFLLSCFFLSELFAQGSTPGIAILDLSQRNQDTNDARLFSALHICKVVGLPLVITQDIAVAEMYAMILCSGELSEQTLQPDEKTSLMDYVSNGGVLLSPRVEDENLFELFGVSGYEGSTARYTFTWDDANPLNADELRWINEPEELTMSLGKDTYAAIFKTLGYSTTTGKALAYFEDNSVAVVSNEYGEGHALTIGVSLSELVVRNQINRDYEAQRQTANAFEPTTDALFLFIRALYAKHFPFAVWKHTSPGNSAATVMITHDIDSASAMDTLKGFVDYEQSHNIEATYNVTVRYFDDELMSPFYLNQQSTMEYIRSHGQAFGSHSVGHFFDFAEEDVFPIGQGGNTPDNYQPYNDGDITLGGTIFGECEVSKNVLEDDVNVPIRTFRAGHLAYPKYLVDVLDSLDYEYNTSNAAADVLTNFPYQNKMGRSFSGAISSVYEIPVTISDVFHINPISSTNYLDKSDIWLAVTKKNRDNGAPSVLLVHPNKNYKLTGMKYYCDQLPDDIHIKEMSRFGDYWKAREALQFNPYFFNNQMTILVTGAFNLEDNVSFIVKDGQLLDAVVVKDALNNTLDFNQQNWEGNDLIVFHENAIWVNNTTTSNNILTKEDLRLHAFPSPTKDLLTIEFTLERADHVRIDLYSMDGEKRFSFLNKQIASGAYRLGEDLKQAGLLPGVYFLVGESNSGVTFREKIILL